MEKSCAECSFYNKKTYQSKCTGCVEYDSFQARLPQAGGSTTWLWMKDSLQMQSGMVCWTSPYSRFFYGKSPAAVDVACLVGKRLVVIARFYVEPEEMEVTVRRAREFCEREESRCRRGEKRS